MRSLEQSEVSPDSGNSPELLKLVDDFRDKVREASEYFFYVDSLKWHSIAKDYREGKLAIVLYANAGAKVDMKRLRSVGANRITLPNVAVFILHSDVHCSAVGDYWKQQFVLVENVKIVESTQGIIPTTVRSYFGYDPIKQSRTGDVYISPLKRRCQKLPTVPEGEFCVTVKAPSVSVANNHPSMVKSGTQVMDGVSACQRKIDEEAIGFFRYEFERISSGCTIYLDGSSVTISQPNETQAEIIDMLLGPFDLPTRPAK
jgi:hypothetical protein